LSVAIVPVRDLVLFPTQIAPIFVRRADSKRAVESAAAADRLLLLVAQKRVEDDAPSFSDLHSVGVVAEMVDLTYLPDGKTVRIFVKALKRAAIAVPISGRCLTAQIDAVRETRGDTAEAVALRKAVLAKLQSYLNIDFSSPPYARLNAISEPGKLADAAVPVLRMSLSKAQEILETIDVIERLEKVLAAMNENKRVA
jgi:ATP-dependent Lon protease